MSEIKYLNLAGLAEFKEELDKVRQSDNLNITEALNDISSSIGNGTLTIKKNSVSQGTFTANQKTNTDINISVPTNITDLGQTAITEIQNFEQPAVNVLRLFACKLQFTCSMLRI